MISIKSKVRKFAATLGYDINRKHYPAHSESVNFDLLMALVATSTMLPRARLVSLYEQVAHCQRSGIEGAFPFGCFCIHVELLFFTMDWLK